MIHQTRNCGFRLSASTHAVSCRLPLQFPFVFRRLQSLQLLLPAHLCRSAYAFRPSLGLTFHGLSPLSVNFLTPAVFAFFRPLQFWVLTTQPLLFLSFSSRFCLAAAFPVLRFRSRFPSFPVLSCLISHAFLPGSCTRLRCSFPFVLP